MTLIVLLALVAISAARFVMKDISLEERIREQNAAAALYREEGIALTEGRLTPHSLAEAKEYIDEQLVALERRHDKSVLKQLDRARAALKACYQGTQVQHCAEQELRMGQTAKYIAALRRACHDQKGQIARTLFHERGYSMLITSQYRAYLDSIECEKLAGDYAIYRVAEDLADNGIIDSTPQMVQLAVYRTSQLALAKDKELEISLFNSVLVTPWNDIERCRSLSMGGDLATSAVFAECTEKVEQKLRATDDKNKEMCQAITLDDIVETIKNEFSYQVSDILRSATAFQGNQYSQEQCLLAAHRYFLEAQHMVNDARGKGEARAPVFRHKPVIHAFDNTDASNPKFVIHWAKHVQGLDIKRVLHL